jgi:2-dehydro-3-deoxygluconokinase
MKRIVTFGEIMLRLSPKGLYRLVQADNFGASYGGAEANVAVSLAGFDTDAAFVTKLPAHEIGQAAVNSLRRYGVDTSAITRGGDRVGIYYAEKGASQRPSKVIYDRSHSAFAGASPGDFDWGRILNGADWFHFTGITPALSDAAAESCLEACKTAKALGVPVSCDINYRKKLWSPEKAGKVMGGLMEYVGLLIANEEDPADVFGIHAKDTEIISGKLSPEGYINTAEELASRFGIKRVGITLRESRSADDNNWAALFRDEGRPYFSRKYPIHIVDRIGGGDSFTAGLIYALLENYGGQEAVEFAAAAGCFKHSIEGDFNLASVEEIQKLARGDSSGRVQR